jgi:hypothetical protein
MLHCIEWFNLMLAARPVWRSPITMDPTLTAGSPLTAADRLPAVEAFPLYGGDALPQNPGSAVQRIEIVSSVEKADGRHPDNCWLVDMAERFNQRRERIGGGPPIKVVVRAIPSGLGACWITQLGLASLLSHMAPIPVWPLLVARYRQLLRKNQLSQQCLSAVIEANDLGVIVNSKPISLGQFIKVASVGEGDGQQIEALRRRYPQSLVLSCQQP